MITVTAATLGIDISKAYEVGVYKWLLASFLIGKRIRSSTAAEAYRTLVDRHGLDSPSKLAGCSHQILVKLLGQAGYARYDESTSRRLHALGLRLEAELHAKLATVVTASDTGQFETWLLSLDGIGPKTLEIFLREFRPYLERTHSAE